MSTTLTLRIACAALIASVAACERTPTEASSGPRLTEGVAFNTNATNGADREVQERLSDLTGSLVAYPCGDNFTEQLRLEGQIFERLTITWDGSGGLHTVTHSMPVGLRGVGLTSGAEYRVTEREQGVFHRGAMEQSTSTYQSILRVSSPERHTRASLVVGGRFTVNANGDVVVERPIARVDCRIAEEQ